MKKVIAIAVCCLMLQSAIAQTRHLRDYCDRQCATERTQLNIPGFLIRFCAEDPELKPLVKRMRSLRILHLERKANTGWASGALNRAIRADGYDEVLSVKDGAEMFGIYITGDENRINSILLAVDSKEELVLLHAKVHMTMDQLSDMLAGSGRQQLQSFAHADF